MKSEFLMNYKFTIVLCIFSAPLYCMESSHKRTRQESKVLLTTADQRVLLTIANQVYAAGKQEKLTKYADIATELNANNRNNLVKVLQKPVYVPLLNILLAHPNFEVNSITGTPKAKQSSGLYCPAITKPYLCIALKAHNFEAAKLLIAKGADTGNSQVIKSVIDRGNVEGVSLLIEYAHMPQPTINKWTNNCVDRLQGDITEKEEKALSDSLTVLLQHGGEVAEESLQRMPDTASLKIYLKKEQEKYARTHKMKQE